MNAILLSLLMHTAPTGWAYPWACCANMDCNEVQSSEVSEPTDQDPEYVIVKTGERIPWNDKRIKRSPDGNFHWCAHIQGIDAGKTICLFVPPRGN